VTGFLELESTSRHRAVIAIRAVITGEVEASQIYSAPSLAARFGVSATPVREAMVDLVSEGRSAGVTGCNPCAKEVDSRGVGYVHGRVGPLTVMPSTAAPGTEPA
jgi:hypothetical protein